MIAEQQKIQFRKLDDVPPWPKAQELADVQARIEESPAAYEQGHIPQSGISRRLRGWKRAKQN